jgi:hypothetical protein
MSVSSAAAKKKDHERPEAVVVAYKWVLSPQLHAGRLTGDAGRAADFWNDNFSERLVYGFGLAVDNFVTRKFSAGIQFAATWKSISDSPVGPVRALTYSARARYFLMPESKQSLYGQFEAGLLSGKLQNYRSSGETSLKFGSHPFILLGAGINGYTSAGTTTSFLVFYQVAFTKDAEVEGYSSNIPYDLTLFGVELGVGFGLKRSK